MAQPYSRSPEAATQRRIETARRILRGSVAPPAAIPRNATADVRFITASLNYRRCAKAYIAATNAWREFSVTHPADDAAHEEHHRRVIAARMALNGADEAFALAESALAKGRGE